MTYERVVNRNHLVGDYDQTPFGAICGDLRRLEVDSIAKHPPEPWSNEKWPTPCDRIAEATSVDVEIVRRVLTEFLAL
ncbi:MAG TPA: hypothetical protein VNN79_05950 [Actinomycetota bacterium]|nr:hypothetical protein [Actinomycetota bacterium]